MKQRSKIAALLLLIAVMWSTSQAQNIGIGTLTPHSSARLEVWDTIRGVLIPRIPLSSDTDKSTIPNPAHSLLIYNTGSGGVSPPGYYYNAGTPNTPKWVRLLSSDNPAVVTDTPLIGDGSAANPIRLINGFSDGDIIVWDATLGKWVIQQPGIGAGIPGICPSASSNFVLKWDGGAICNSVIYDDGTNVGIGTTTPSYKLEVNGLIKSLGINEISDARLKEHITLIKPEEGIEVVLELEPVYYYWSEEYQEIGYPANRQIGFIAQQVELLLPEVVKIDKKGYYSIDYTRVIPILTAAIQYQQEQIKAQQKEVYLLKKQIEILKQENEQLKNLLLRTNNSRNHLPTSGESAEQYSFK